MKRRAFTLVELLIAVAIIAVLGLLAILTIHAYDITDGSATAANRTVAAMYGARDRAAAYGERRGVRIIQRDGFGTALVPIYGPYSHKGTVSTTTTGNRTVLGNLPPVWARMEGTGALQSGVTLFIQGNHYHLVKSGNRWETTRPVFKPYDNHSSVPYVLHGLKPIIDSHGRITKFPKHLVIDLKNSIIPPSWKRPNGTYIGELDIMFQPDGRRNEYLMPGGSTIMLLITDISDSDKVVGDLSKTNQEKVVAVLRRGLVSAHEIDKTDANNNGIADDPFNYAHLGR